jgi:hypothetical protein
VNLNKKWCSKFLKRVRDQGPPNQEKTVEAPKAEEKTRISETFYELFSEPESEQAEVTVSNTSSLWRAHTIELLGYKYPYESGRKRRGRRPREAIMEPGLVANANHK